MNVKITSADGESDGEVTQEAVAALRQVASVATTQADKLEKLLGKVPETDLLTFNVAAATEYRSYRKARPGLPDASLVRRLIRHRQMRLHCLDRSLFGEPAWDMLLDLTAAKIEGKRLAVTSVCIASGVPATTALRWIGILVEHGLVERVSDPLDRRRSYITLSEKGERSMASYFEMIAARP